MKLLIQRALFGLALIILVVWLMIQGIKEPSYAWYTSSEEEQAEYVKLITAQQYAYNQAIECSGVKPKLQFKEIRWALMPGSVLQMHAEDGSIRLAGFFNPTDSTIYIPFTKRFTNWILVHESLHAIGFLGHPEIPFRYPCRVLAEQNY